MNAQAATFQAIPPFQPSLNAHAAVFQSGPPVQLSLNAQAPIFRSTPPVRNDSFAGLVNLFRDKQPISQDQQKTQELVRNDSVVIETFDLLGLCQSLESDNISEDDWPSLNVTSCDSSSSSGDLCSNFADFSINQTEPASPVELGPMTVNNMEAQLTVLRATQHPDLPNQPDDESDRSVGELQYQVKASKKYLSGMRNEIRQLQIEGQSKDQDIQALKAQITDQNRVLQEVERWKAIIAQYEDQHESCEKNIKELKEQAGHTNNHIHELDLKHKSVQLLANQKDQQLEELQNQLSSTDTIRNQNRILQKQVSNNAKIMQKLEAGKALKGAAHLVVPSSNERLPEEIFPCINCFVKDLKCNHQSTCVECQDSKSPCARWRCSIRHITGECLELPCQLKHDDAGWLVYKLVPPVW